MNDSDINLISQKQILYNYLEIKYIKRINNEITKNKTLCKLKHNFIKLNRKFKFCIIIFRQVTYLLPTQSPKKNTIK